MFSGIIQSLQPVQKISNHCGHLWLTVKKPAVWKTKLGESISVNGVCSTITKQTKNNFTFEFMPETLRLTTLGGLKNKDLVNLERSLKLNDLVGGHLVSGHIDCVGKISKIISDHKSKIYTFSFPKKFEKFVINKGSIAINGISLTIFNKNQVALIQHTLSHTNFRDLKINDQVNLEFDLIGKYLQNYVQRKS